MILRCCIPLIICLLSCTLLSAQIRFTFNNVDTISAENRALIEYFKRYVQHRASGENPDAFWFQDEAIAFPDLDTYENWVYPIYAHNPATILGISRPDDRHYKIKTLIRTGTPAEGLLIYAIQNFIIRETGDGFKMRDVLAYQLEKENYRKVRGKYFDFYLPEQTPDYPVAEIEEYLGRVENYFRRRIPYRFTYIYAENCEALHRIRGYDYVANMMSAKTSVCGLTDTGNRIMYSSDAGVHKHELLRLLNVMFPESAPVLRNGLTNLIGGAAGKPIHYHIKKLAPYVLNHPDVLGDLEAFYYYDDETNPHFVFDALAINYFIKLHGETALRHYMSRSDLSQTDLEVFLRDHCGINDIPAFLIGQLKAYSSADRAPEYADLF